MTFMRTLFDTLIAARRRAAAIAELQQYDDHLLRDIGITRSEIVDYVDGRLAWESRGVAADGAATETTPLGVAA